MPKLLPSLGLENETLPLWWTTDFIVTDKPDGGDQWIVGEFNCSCVGISACLEACATEECPNAGYYDVKGEKKEEAEKIAGIIGQKALQVLIEKKRTLET